MSEAVSTEFAYQENNDNGAPVFQSVMSLLADTFDLDIEPLKTFDLFEPTYRSFSYLDKEGNCAANVSAIHVPLFLSGNPVKAMGIQSVATSPAHRHRGLSRNLLSRALAWCDERTDLILLHTSIPDFYLPFGFRIVREHFFVGKLSEAIGETCAYKLSWESNKDRDLLRKMLLERSPTSKVASIFGLPGMFILNAMGTEGLCLYHLPALQVIVALRHKEDGTLCLLDIIGRKMPSLARILGALGCASQMIEAHFSPDLLGWNGTETPCQKKKVLMGRGKLDVECPFMLQPTLAF
ncbi:MAG: GNAT family N-acetyltransferase [Alphaproteobacteria bacterium]|nr:GNAT family N-acetyltransferase [Alphaproteobacteria bacterium]